ncbi:MAG: hypothetical protein R3324_06540, partial [Halobacteriales archaeon]|nr:hypothetical protein [Halobacteriales archaeon]
HHLVVRAGATRETVPVPVDGNSRPITIRFDEALSASSGVRFEPGPYGIEIENVTLRQGKVVGSADRAPESLRVDGTRALPAVQPDPGSGTAPLPVGETVGSPDGDRVVALPLPPTPANVVWLEADVRLLKPMDPDTWKLVEASYRNVLDFEGLENARRRTYLSGGTTAGGTHARSGLHR